MISGWRKNWSQSTSIAAESRFAAGTLFWPRLRGVTVPELMLVIPGFGSSLSRGFPPENRQLAAQCWTSSFWNLFHAVVRSETMNQWRKRNLWTTSGSTFKEEWWPVHFEAGKSRSVWKGLPKQRIVLVICVWPDPVLLTGTKVPNQLVLFLYLNPVYLQCPTIVGQ